jgi:hypothetical protein
MQNTIESLPLHEAARFNDPLELDTWCDEQQLRYKPWFLPQALANIGRWRVHMENNQVLVGETLKQNLISEWHLGLWRVLARAQRGRLVQKQNQPESAQYSQLVPLILAALKRDQNILYNQWPREELGKVIHQPLWDCIIWADSQEGGACRNLGSLELVEIREQGLTTRTGKSAGRQKDPLGTWSLTGLQGTPLHGAPRLISTMLTQIWVAHPRLRVGYMILDPWDLDRVPQSLWTEEELFQEELPPTPEPKKSKVLDMPWD